MNALYVILYVLFFSSRRRHTRCALVTGVQTCALPIYYGGKPLNAPFCINQKSRHSGNVLHAQERVLRRRHRLPEASCNRSMVSRRSFVVCGSPASVRGCRPTTYEQYGRGFECCKL